MGTNTGATTITLLAFRYARATLSIVPLRCSSVVYYLHYLDSIFCGFVGGVVDTTHQQKRVRAKSLHAQRRLETARQAGPG